MTREDYDKIFLNALVNDNILSEPDQITQLSEETFWLNPRRGLRLSYFGFNILTEKLGLEPTEFVLQDWKDNQNHMLLSMEKYFPSPYFLHPARESQKALGVYKSVSVISGKIAMAIGLIGSVEDYVRNIKKTS